MPSKAMNMVSERPDQSLFGDADRSDDMEHGLVQELVAPAGWDEASYLRVAEIADGGEAWQQARASWGVSAARRRCFRRGRRR